MLSCDCIESAKFIHGTLSLAKRVYYNTAEWYKPESVKKMERMKFFKTLKLKKKDSSTLARRLDRVLIDK